MKKKTNLIEIFVAEYGEKYREKIVKTFNSLYINFDSEPFENLIYGLKHINEINKQDLIILYKESEQYNKIQDDAYEISANKLNDYIVKNFNIQDLNLLSENIRLFYSYFFKAGYVDFFSTNNKNMLNDVNTSNLVKGEILENQKKCRLGMLELGIDIDLISQSTIDDFIAFKEKMIQEIKLYIMENSDYGEKIYNELKIKLGTENIYYEQMDAICFKEHPFAGLFYYPEEKQMYSFIKYPIVLLLNRGNKCIDVNIIHELIHRIEKNEIEGYELMTYGEKNTNDIVKEVRTQKLAIKITRKLHNNGIFIYDDPTMYKIEGECLYELLFPLFSDFLEEYESFFNECAINNMLSNLEDEFGEGWNDFTSYITSIYNQMLFLNQTNGKLTNNFISENMLRTSLNLIQSMREYRNDNLSITK